MDYVPLHEVLDLPPPAGLTRLTVADSSQDALSQSNVAEELVKLTRSSTRYEAEDVDVDEAEFQDVGMDDKTEGKSHFIATLMPHFRTPHKASIIVFHACSIAKVFIVLSVSARSIVRASFWY